MGDRLVLDAARTNVGVCCGPCRERRHKFAFAPDWQQGDGCPCCWTHEPPRDGSPTEDRVVELMNNLEQSVARAKAARDRKLSADESTRDGRTDHG